MLILGLKGLTTSKIITGIRDEREEGGELVTSVVAGVIISCKRKESSAPPLISLTY